MKIVAQGPSLMGAASSVAAKRSVFDRLVTNTPSIRMRTEVGLMGNHDGGYWPVQGKQRLINCRTSSLLLVSFTGAKLAEPSSPERPGKLYCGLVRAVFVLWLCGRRNVRRNLSLFWTSAVEPGGL